ncbi:replicative helicase loader/inhibitor [Paenibacillus donghaensis]|uniref:replicative helicase loader/inhibitor n=1 Tax=Paenibacillus donghaensis TaxID=414771 RepID=UPI001FE7CEA8|nr:replicative helicase loader/inhibitor [Paenibacillus donghaensis]
MDRVGVTLLLKYLSAAYRSFRIDEDEVEGVIRVWADILQDIPTETAMAATRRLCRTKTDFAPSPGEIYQACTDSGTELTVYQIQKQEQQARVLELQEYHETEEVGPAPDFVQKRIDAIFRSKVKPDES